MLIMITLPLTGVMAQPPANDLCVNATAIACGETLSNQTNAFATSTGDPTASCGTTPGTPSVWYTFAGNNMTVTLATCGFDTKMNVYRGSCSALTCVGGNDDTTIASCSATTGESQVTFLACSGTTYYILVGGFSGATGTFTLSATCAAPPAPPTTCPTLSAPAANATNVSIAPTFSWTAVTGATGYNVYLASSGTSCPGTPGSYTLVGSNVLSPWVYNGTL